LRPTGRARAGLLVFLTLGVFLLFSVVWAAVLDVKTQEELLKNLGVDRSAILLVGGAVLTCVVAPICEEVLFRGFIFSALSSWRGAWPAAILTGVLFGAVHAGSAPAVDLAPLAFLGFALCVLYRATGSLYPCVAAHSISNSIAFASLDHWGLWEALLLVAAALGLVALVALALRAVGVITGESPPRAVPVALAE
ncbi:MAG TPA: CPBP family intramembrane glutamic endopeptidase, partial [Solirubrobacteraceae bacterium]|nr:CPBP family intramembrane glutamic endopeptidase [Solirubrobacteraceae bacterium]